jgi:hypothetical protein
VKLLHVLKKCAQPNVRAGESQRRGGRVKPAHGSALYDEAFRSRPDGESLRVRILSEANLAFSFMTNRPSFFRNHGLSLAMFVLFLGFLAGQILTGQRELNDEREKRGEPAFGLGEYVRSAHFFEATAENWESEFFQMFVYVFATAFLYQKGSAESKDPRKKHKHHCDEKTPIPPDAPWPVKRGGWVLVVYEHSLSLAFLGCFFVAFALHAYGGHRLYNQERFADGERLLSVGQYLGSSRFWFESFQNWQSEFLAIGSMVVLSIFLREKNSPESKEVETPHWENEED